GAGAAVQWLDLRTAIAISTSLFAVALALTLAGIPASPGRDVGWDLRGPLRQIAGHRAFAVAAVGMLGATMLWGTVQAYLPVFGKEHLGLAPTQIGYMVAIQAVANGLARIPGGRLVDRLRRRGLLAAIGLGVYAVAIAVL